MVIAKFSTKYSLPIRNDIDSNIQDIRVHKGLINLKMRCLSSIGKQFDLGGSDSLDTLIVRTVPLGQ